ncbi:MAG: ABC transporter substrate-binding protein [Rhizobiales bacterium]|nr:ABC transporter substrate-binding protein [Hyphomicrobiales bacterium]
MRKSVLLASALAAMMLAGPAKAEDTIKIGVTQPLTGAFAASGNYVADGARLAAEEINANGGVLGKKIELIIEDNKSNPTEAVATAEKLIVSNGVQVMMGAWSSTLTLAVMPKLMEYQIPMLVETSSSGKITTSGNPYIFRISPTSEMEAQAFTPLVASLGIKKAAFLSTNNDFGLGAADKFAAMLQSQGVEVVTRETMDPKATEFSAQLGTIKASGADTVFVTTAVEQITLILRQAKDLQLTARIITTGGSNSPDQLIAQAGAAAEGSHHLVFFTPWFPDAVANPDVAKTFVARWNAKGHKIGGLTEGFRGWDGIHTIVAAISAAGKVEAEAIRAALWGVTVKGINGNIAFIKQGPAGQESAQNVPSVYLVKIEGGKVVRGN